MRGRVIGLGRALACDDAVGLLVVEHLRRVGVPVGVELHAVSDASAIVPLLQTASPVAIVDAIASRRAPGEIVTLDEGALRTARARPVSSHGVDVADAVALARAVDPTATSPRIALVGVAIAHATELGVEPSPAVRAAIPAAARAALAWLDGA